MTEVIIGRNAQDGRLCMSVGGKKQSFGQPQSVPQSISREHLCLRIDNDGTVTLKNLNIENDLYVNGFGVEQKQIKEGDRIELGRERYLLSWEFIRPFVPNVVDVTPLKQVWNDYQSARLQLQIRERRFGVLRSATGLITMAAIVSSIFAGHNMLYLILYVAGGLISLIFFIIALLSASRIPQKYVELEEETRKKYHCPACHSLFNLQNYDMLVQAKKCSHCGAVFKK